jgi:hypothetical protein
MSEAKGTFSLFESLRRFLPIGRDHERRAPVYGLSAFSATLTYAGAVHSRETGSETEIPLRYASGYPLSLTTYLSLLIMFGRVYRLAGVCRVCTFTIVSAVDIVPAIVAIVAARLAGARIVLNDCLFFDRPPSRLLTRLRLLADRIATFDSSSYPDHIRAVIPIDNRKTACDKTRYAGFRKERAIPHVIAYGDFEDTQTMAMVVRSLELIKQKYPRAEFYLPIFADTTAVSVVGANKHAVHTVSIRDDSDLQKLFADSDILVCLSSGGFTPVLEFRARAAGMPCIQSGVHSEASAAGSISVPRGSFSGLADAVIKLTDDDSYYRSCAQGA